jgi:hypothetical protein
MTGLSTSQILIYRTPESIRWCRDRERILIIHEEAGQAISLTGFDAAVWIWSSLEYSQEDLLAFAQEFLQVSLEEAHARLNQVINHWVEQDILQIEDAA